MQEIEIQWSPSHQARQKAAAGRGGGGERHPSGPSRNALRGLQLATIAARDFDATFSSRNVEREMSIPLFSGDEVILESAQPIRMTGYYSEYGLQGVNLVIDSLRQGDFGGDASAEAAEEVRARCADRILESNGQHYSAKYLQKGIIDTDHGPAAATEMIVETKILMNMAPHPNILQIYGVNQHGIDAFLESGRKGFFLLTDRLEEMLVDRIDSWRRGDNYAGGSGQRLDDLTDDQSHFMQRLEIANDICSALVWLHDRQLVMNIRPDKVGFDTKCGRVKLCNFGQARQNGMDCSNGEEEYSLSSITKSDDVAGTLAYTAPEVLCMAPATLASDVYAFGIMVWEVMSLRRPFESYNRALHYERVVENNERPPIDKKMQKDWPSDICKLLKKSWDPHFRPTIKVVGETLETTLLFHDPSASSSAGNKASSSPSATDLRQDPLSSSTAATCDPNERSDIKKPSTSSPGGGKRSRSRGRGVERSKSSDFHAFTNGTAPSSRTIKHRNRSSSRRRRKSAGGAALVAPYKQEHSTRNGRKISMEATGTNAAMQTPVTAQRRKVPNRTRSLTSTPSPGLSDDLAILREALTKLSASPANSIDTLPTALSTEDTGSDPVIRSPVRRRASGRIPAVPNAGSPSGRSNTSSSTPSHIPSPTGSRSSNSPSRRSSRTTPSSSSRQGRGVQRRTSDLGPRLAESSALPSNAPSFSLDNIMPSPVKQKRSISCPRRKVPPRTSSAETYDSAGSQQRLLPPVPMFQSSPTSVASSPKGRNKGMKKCLSARDVAAKPTQQNDQNRYHGDRNDDRRAAHAISDDVVAKLKAEASSSSLSTTSSNEHRVIRVKVRKSRRPSNATVTSIQ